MLLEFERDLDGEKYKPENMIGTKGVGKVPGGNGGKFLERESASWEGAAHQRGNDMASSGGTEPHNPLLTKEVFQPGPTLETKVMAYG